MWSFGLSEKSESNFYNWPQFHVDNFWFTNEYFIRNLLDFVPRKLPLLRSMINSQPLPPFSSTSSFKHIRRLVAGSSFIKLALIIIIDDETSIVKIGIVCYFIPCIRLWKAWLDTIATLFWGRSLAWICSGSWNLNAHHQKHSIHFIHLVKNYAQL